MLTTTRIRALKATGKNYRVSDAGPCKGLGISVSRQGHKVYNLSVRRNGKRSLYKIGDCSNTGLAEARELGLELRRKLDKGEDIRAPQTVTKVGTVEDLIDGYLEDRKSAGVKTVVDMRRTLEFDAIPAIGTKIANEVTPEDIADVIRRPVMRGSPGVANRLRGFLHAAYAWGAAADLDPRMEKNGSQFKIGANPVTPVPKPVRGSNPLDRWLSEDEIRDVWTKLPLHSGPAIFMSVRMMLATGQRASEVPNMKWTDIEDGFYPDTTDG